MNRKLRWGILGTGNIARQFAAGVLKSERGELTAVGSRQRDTAQAFADAYRVSGIHANYDALLADRDVEAIYVSLPNSMHHEWTIKALSAGKHVLCEKPFASSVSETEQMFAAAEKAGKILVEAFMYRSHPITHAVLEAVRAGSIGELRVIRTSFSFRVTRIADNIRFKPELAGGALMDIGCYCINYSRLLAGQEPSVMQAVAHRHEQTGVDDITAGTMLFPSGVVASFVCGMSAQTNNTAILSGTDGYIEVPWPWKPPADKPTEFTVARGIPPRQDARPSPAPGTPGEGRGEGSSEISNLKFEITKDPHPTLSRSTGRGDNAASAETRCVDVGGKDLYGMEADDFAAAVLDGAPPVISKADTLGNMRVLDEMRRQIGTTNVT